MDDLTAALRAAFAPEQLSLNPADCDRYLCNTMGARRQLLGAVRPADTAEVQRLVCIAREQGAPLYPISTGNNWGYGTALPALDGCLLVDLSGLNRIVHFDPDLATVTLEPGVTQGMLFDFLAQQPERFLVPTTGAGPQCSLVGNALERGYGITPVADHFAAVQSVEAVLGSGDLYQGPFEGLGATTVERCFKWGLGPYIDGLFGQFGAGIVTRMTFQLAPVPTKIQAFYFWIDADSGLDAAVAAVRDLQHRLPGVLGSINLMNARRLLSMMGPYPRDQVRPGTVMSEALVADLARENRVSAWMGFGALYGEAPVVAGARRVVRQRLKGVADRSLFVSPNTVARLRPWAERLPFAWGRKLADLAGTLDRSLRLVAGEPSEIALPLAYWRLSGDRTPDAGLSPAEDGAGLLWYAPLVPMQPEAVAAYRGMVERVCTAHGIEPLVTFTSLSARCFDSTVPILFDPKEPGARERAHACFEALFAEGKALGFVPYRLNVEAQRSAIDYDSTYWKLVGRIKQAMDPDNLIAPGRYAPVELPDSAGQGNNGG